MPTAYSDLPQVFLKPGEVHMCRGSAVLKTILGSCVGVTFWSARLGLGALCHGILPRSPAGAESPDGYRYVDFAIRDLVRRFERLGANRTELEIKVFGGANVLPVTTRARTVGENNLQVAMQVLREEGLNVKGTEAGGNTGRTIRFQTWDGHVYVRRHSTIAHRCTGACRYGGPCEYESRMPLVADRPVSVCIFG